MAAPTYFPEWATTDVTLTSANTPNKIRPSQSLREIGYDKDQIPSCQNYNWQFKNIYDWVSYLDTEVQTLSASTAALVYPVGSLYSSTVSTNPGTTLIT